MDGKEGRVEEDAQYHEDAPEGVQMVESFPPRTFVLGGKSMVFHGVHDGSLNLNVRLRAVSDARHLFSSPGTLPAIQR